MKKFIIANSKAVHLSRKKQSLAQMQQVFAENNKGDVIISEELIAMRRDNAQKE